LVKIEEKIIAIIPCRICSTRLLIKPLQNVGERTILALLVEQLKKSKKIDEIVLAIAKTTGSELFTEFAKKNSLRYCLGSESDVLGRFIKTAKMFKGNIIVRITSDNPFIFWEGIDELIDKHLENNYDLSCNYRLPLGAGLEVINRKALEIAHNNGNKWDKEHCSPFIYKNPKKFKILKLKPNPQLERPDIRITVDTPQDLWVARQIYSKLNKNGKPIRLERIIKFLDNNSSIKNINSKLKHTKRFN
jgi:spore coat polysaccharide biosynthesis protein SpsF